MSEGGEPSFSVEQAMKAQRALRCAVGKGAEQFPLRAFVGMISDEIQDLRAAGRSDQDIAEIITRETGKLVTAPDLARHYAPPEYRQGPDEQ